MIQVENSWLVALGLALLLVGAGLFVVSGPVAADHETDSDGFIDTAISGDAPPLTDSIGAVAAGMTDRAKYAVSGWFGDGGPNATESADALQEEYNTNSAAYEEWAADHRGVSSEHNVLAIEQTVDGETETRYLVADIGTDSDGNDVYENSSMESSLPDGEDVDETVSLDGSAAQNADDELSALRESHVESGEDLTRDDPAIVRLVTTYSNHFSTTTGGL